MSRNSGLVSKSSDISMGNSFLAALPMNNNSGSPEDIVSRVLPFMQPALDI